MKKVTCKLYEFSELSKEVREKLIEEKRWDLGYSAMEFNSNDRTNTINKFEKVFGVTVNYEVSYCENFWRVEFDDEAIYTAYDNDGDYYDITPEEVSGKLLLRYLNYKWLDLHYLKKYWGQYRRDDNGKSLTKTRTSRILWGDCCPLTGVCYDEDILKPIRHYLRKPDKTISLKDLLEECVGEFMESWYEEYQFCCDDEDFLEEEFENKHYDDLFFADGTIFEGVYEEVVA